MALPPEYQPRYVAFIDILGFANKVEQIGSNEAVFAQLLNINSVIEKTADESQKMGGAFELSNLRWTAFSDTIVISVPDVGSRMAIFFTLMISTMTLCQNLLKLGALTRGGIAKGHSYHTDKVLFGPAVIDAYHLERDVASYARIVVSAEVADEWRSAYVLPNDLAMRELIKRDQDGAWYLDLFFFPEQDSLDKTTDEFFYKSRFVIENMLRDIGIGLKEWLKIAWLATKYNEAGLVTRRKKYLPILLSDSPAR